MAQLARRAVLNEDKCLNVGAIWTRNMNAMALGWAVFGVGIASGVVLRSRGFAIPVVYEVAVWVAKNLSGDFVNHSGNGDNFAAEATLAGTIGVLVGLLGVLVGLGLRALTLRVPRAR